MEYHSEKDMPYPIIKFVKQPESFGCKIAGEIYQQTGPFQSVERDWNHDGDIYTQKIAGFQKMTAINEHAHDYFYLSEHDFADLVATKCIEYVKQPELAFLQEKPPQRREDSDNVVSQLSNKTVKNLITAMVAYGLESVWNDSEIIDALVGLGVTYEDFCQAGAKDFVKDYFEDTAKERPAPDTQKQLFEQAMCTLDEVLAKPNGYELFYIANILYMLQQDETPLDREEQLAMARRIWEVSTSSVVPLLTAERVDAVCTLLNNGITDRRSPEFPSATPEQMKELLLNCDIAVFAEIIEAVAVDNQEFYAPDNEYSQDTIELRQKAVNAIHDVVNPICSTDINVADRETVEQEIWNLLARAEKKSSFSRELDVDSPYYKKAMELLEGHCSCTCPEVYDMLFDSSLDLFFKDGEKFDYNLFYYNPNSNAGGQIVQCPFSKEQAERMINNNDYVDVLAENTQYLYDINDICFFEGVFNLLDLKNEGRYLGNSLDQVCQDILDQSKENTPVKPYVITADNSPHTIPLASGISDIIMRVEPDRFTKTTSATLCSDSIDGRKVVCVDLCYDSSEKLTGCDVVNLIELPFSDEAIQFGCFLLEKLEETYHIPVYSEISYKNKQFPPPLSDQIQFASACAAESQSISPKTPKEMAPEI